MADNEITVNASVQGRRITLDPINETTDLAVPARRVESSLPAGLRVSWVEDGKHTLADGTELTFEMTCGAGVGSPWLVLNVRDADGEMYADEVIDIRHLVGAWLARVERDGRTPPR